MNKIYFLLILILPFIFSSCDKKESDAVLTAAVVKARLLGRWNKVSYEQKLYGKGTTTLLHQSKSTFAEKHYDEYTETEYSEIIDDQKINTTTYKVPDEKHIIHELNGGANLVTWEIKELTSTKLVVYREYLINQPGSDQDGDKVTVLYTCSR